MNEQSTQALINTGAFYCGEPCRICGQIIKSADLPVVLTGYSADDKSRAAHKDCWESRPKAQEQWAHP